MVQDVEKVLEQRDSFSAFLTPNDNSSSLPPSSSSPPLPFYPPPPPLPFYPHVLILPSR